MSRLRNARHTTVVFAVAASIVASTPDERLWNAGKEALSAGKFDVANVTLHTLVNTYPHSKYAADAQSELLDPRILATCNNWGVPQQCDERQLSAISAKSP